MPDHSTAKAVNEPAAGQQRTGPYDHPSGTYPVKISQRAPGHARHSGHARPAPALPACQRLRQAAGRAVPGSDGWCSAMFWLGYTVQWTGDLAGSLKIFTELRDAVADRGPSRALADGYGGRTGALLSMGRFAEAAEEDRRSLAVARQVGYPLGEVLVLGGLSAIAVQVGDLDSAVRAVREAVQITVGVQQRKGVTLPLPCAGPGRRGCR
jgi:hypothetical protein